MERKLDRRSFLKGMGVVGAGAMGMAVAGCAPKASAQSGSEGTPASESDEVSRPDAEGGRDKIVGEACSDVVIDGDIEVAETREVDVVVVGSGMAGMVATLAGAEAGLAIVCLEKLAALGGTTSSAEGMFGANSAIQHELGYDAELDDYFSEIQTFNHWTNNPRICRRWLEHAGDTVDWAVDHGMGVREVLASWSTVPTWHVYEGRGTAVIAAFAEAARAAGAEILTKTPARKLLVDESGAAAGVIAVDADGKAIQYNAKAVVLCSGGYACNKEMVETYTGWGWFEDEDWETNGYTVWKGAGERTGDGILMAQGAGADLFRVGAVMADFNEVAGLRTPEDHPVRCLLGVVPTLWVNEKAKRFTNEGLIDDFVAYGESSAAQKEVYNVMDHDFIVRQSEGVIAECCGTVPKGTVFENALQSVEEAVEGDQFLVWKADTLEDLAAQMGLDPQALVDTVERYNGMCDAGRDADYMKPADYLIPVKTPPFYGVKMCPVYMTTVGGVRVDERMRVISAEGDFIKGLYACGSDAGGLYGYLYDVNVAAGSQQSFCAVGARFAIEDILENVMGGGDGYVPASEEMDLKA